MPIDFDKMLTIVDSMIVIEASQTLPRMTAKELDRFISKLPFGHPDECWEWQGSRSDKNYGIFRVTPPGTSRNKDYYTSRLAYRFFFQEDPDTLFVCHKCDNPPCCNPLHLFLGTARDNNADKTKKVRQAQGERIATSKLTSARVLEIRERDAKRKRGRGSRTNLCKQMAADYGVSMNCITAIVYGVAWRHLLPNYEPGKRVIHNPDRHAGDHRRFNAKLSVEDVLEVYNTVNSPDRTIPKCHLIASLASRFNVYPSTIKKIAYGWTWQSITGAVGQDSHSLPNDRDQC